MLPRFIRLLGPALFGVMVAGAPAPASAQDQPTEFQTWNVPGWTFTPDVIVGTLYDSNVTLLAPGVGQTPASDQLFQLEPFGQIEYFGRRTTLNGGYHGSLRRYFDLGELDTLEHRAFLSLRTRVSRRLTVYANENFAHEPSTDLL